MSIEPFITRAHDLWTDAVGIWFSGGWAMPAIAVTALVLFALGIHVHLRLRATGFLSVPERRWRRWIVHPAERSGRLGRLIDTVGNAPSIAEMTRIFGQLRTTEITPFDRDLRVMRICVSAAPLLGLLGTVTGMLTTFSALSSGSGGEETMTLVAGGISEALVTTETGLVIALAGLFFQYQLARRHNRYKAFLAHLETVCTQHLYAHLRRQERSAAA